MADFEADANHFQRGKRPVPRAGFASRLSGSGSGSPCSPGLFLAVTGSLLLFRASSASCFLLEPFSACLRLSCSRANR